MMYVRFRCRCGMWSIFFTSVASIFAMLRFRRMRSLQKFAAVHSKTWFSARPRGEAAAGVAGHTPFNLDRHLNHRDRFKESRQVALEEWRDLAA